MTLSVGKEGAKKRRRYIKVSKKSLHGIVWGGEGSGLGIKLNKKQTLWFMGTDRTNPLIRLFIEEENI